MNNGYSGGGTVPPRSPGRPEWGFTGVIIAVGVAVSVLLLGTAIGVAAGWPAFGLWITGFVPVVYGVIQLFLRRGRRGLIAIAAGVLAGIVAFSTIPSDAGTVAEPAPKTISAEEPSAPSPVPSPAASSTPAPSTQAPSSPAPSSPATATSSPASSRAAPKSTAKKKAAPTTKAPAKLTTAQVVAALAVKGRGPKTGYDRDLFKWNGFDFDRNGCDQRNDVLMRDMHKPVIKAGSNGCRVEAGWLQDRYSGTAIYLPRAKVDIDHVVALSNAWQMGAAQWDELKRHQFANDPLNLVATTQHANRQKGDANAASWLPPTNRCSYIARQAAVKQKYGLAVTSSERDAMNRVLTACPNQKLPTGAEAAPRQKSSSSPAPTKPKAAKPKTTRPPANPKAAKPPAQKTDPQFGTCKAAKQNGYGPYVRGKDPEYGWYQDRDKDGVVCE